MMLFNYILNHLPNYLSNNVEGVSIVCKIMNLFLGNVIGSSTSRRWCEI